MKTLKPLMAGFLLLFLIAGCANIAASQPTPTLVPDPSGCFQTKL